MKNNVFKKLPAGVLRSNLELEEDRKPSFITELSPFNNTALSSDSDLPSSLTKRLSIYEVFLFFFFFFCYFLFKDSSKR
jgi:hypothetical protein